MNFLGHCCPACEGLEASLRLECDAPSKPGRRALFAAALAGTAGLMATPPAVAQVFGGGPRSIAIHRLQTGESVNGTYWHDGRYDREMLRQLDWVMRDPRMSEATPMDPRLFDVLATVQARMGAQGEAWHVVSGYRAPETNAMRSRQSRRVSRVSLHMSGMAADVQLTGRNSLQLARVAAEMQLGGVGLYRRDGFIHLDCGPVRRW
jgi:uncharacterized protein YcbK (DUF882 family)